jgi:hypothetical protein
MKEYPFELYGLCEFEGCNIACYMTKGHHDKQLFVSAVKEQYGADINIEWVHHSYGKHVPVKGSHGCVIAELKEPTRGSYPMTYIDV